MDELGLIHLSEKNFKGTSIIDLNKPALVMVMASWCHYCVESKPKFASASKKNTKVEFRVIQSDSKDPDEEALFKRFSKGVEFGLPILQGFPSFFIYLNGQWLQWMCSQQEADILKCAEMLGGGAKSC
jgi:thiol-disulfide isomerase/thioredoxin